MYDIQIWILPANLAGSHASAIAKLCIMLWKTPYKVTGLYRLSIRYHEKQLNKIEG